MTIYEAIKARLDAGEKKIPVTCLIYGKLMCFACLDANESPYPIACLDIKKHNCRYSKYGQYYYGNGHPQLAIGHYDSQIATAQAIAEQNYDTE